MAAKKRKKSHKKHCNSKREVLQMVEKEVRAKHPDRNNGLAQQLKTINQLRPVIERAKQRTREREDSKNDGD